MNRIRTSFWIVAVCCCCGVVSVQRNEVRVFFTSSAAMTISWQLMKMLITPSATPLDGFTLHFHFLFLCYNRLEQNSRHCQDIGVAQKYSSHQLHACGAAIVELDTASYRLEYEKSAAEILTISSIYPCSYRSIYLHMILFCNPRLQ